MGILKLHTHLCQGMIDVALMNAKTKGFVTSDVFAESVLVGSRSHDHGFEIHLGTYDKFSLPEGYKNHGKTMKVRKFANSGGSGAGSVYAATYDEWGWFISEIFALDSGAAFGRYKSAADFHKQTKDAYHLDGFYVGLTGDPDHKFPVRWFATEKEAAEYISTLPGHDAGLFYMDAMAEAVNS